MVERQPSKLRVAGSNPVSRSRIEKGEAYGVNDGIVPRYALVVFRFYGSAHVAQSAEHILGKDEVTGSIPVMGSMKQRVLS